jgi:RNA polymerase sigma factor (sigma-70 family)
MVDCSSTTEAKMPPPDLAKDLTPAAAQTATAQATEASAAVQHTTTLARLFEEHNRALHSFLMARLGNEQEVQEVTQEAYARLLQLDHPGTVSFPRAYLFKTAVNIAVDRTRQRRSRDRLDQVFSEDQLVDSTTPDRHLLASEDLALVEQALYELPPKYRRAFILRRYHEWTPEEIAGDLGIGTRMVRNYICRTTVYCKLRLDGICAADARNRVIP